MSHTFEIGNTTDGATPVTIFNQNKKAVLFVRQFTDDLDGNPDVYFNVTGEILVTLNNGEADYQDICQHASQHDGVFSQESISEVINAIAW